MNYRNLSHEDHQAIAEEAKRICMITTGTIIAKDFSRIGNEIIDQIEAGKAEIVVVRHVQPKG